MIDRVTGKIINPLPQEQELTTITISTDLFDDLKFIRHSGFIPYTFVDSWSSFLEYILGKAIDGMGIKEKLEAKYNEMEELESKGSNVLGASSKVQYNNITYTNKENGGNENNVDIQ